MNKQELLARCDYFNQVHGVTLRLIDEFSDEELGFRPRAGMRTPRELVFHIYAQERALAEAARQGQFTIDLANRSNPEDPAQAAALAALARVSDARDFADACHRAADGIYRSLSEDGVARLVESPLGHYPAWRYFLFAYDEHWHHRGQLCTYLRLLGKEPVMVYDYSPSAGS